MKLLTTLAGLALALTVGLSALTVQDAQATEASAKPAMDEKAMIAEQIPTYPMTTCLISGEALTEMGEPKDMLHEGRLVRLCCGSCVKAFKKDPAAMMAQIDAAIVAEQAPNYPLETCPISGKALGSMGDPVDVFHGTRLVRLCCEGCLKGYEKDPAAAIAKLDAAYIAAQLPTYALTTCPVSGEALEDEKTIDMLYGNTLVRFCCKSCIKSFKKDPAAYMAKVHPEKKQAMPVKKMEKEKDGHNG